MLSGRLKIEARLPKISQLADPFLNLEPIMVRSFHVLTFVSLVAFVVSPPTASANGVGPIDVLLSNGTIHIGDGRDGFVGDVAIADGRIVAVGKFEAIGVKFTIDCEGLVICPGFIDLHNHSDRQVLEKSTRSLMSYVTQGCTTVVTGNCGSGPDCDSSSTHHCMV